MHKDELLQLHSLLCQVKRFFHDAKIATGDVFEEYDELEVSPQHIHKSKTDHKRAVFLLGKGLSEIVMAGESEHSARLRERFERMAAGKKAHPAPPPMDDTPAPAPVREEDSHLPAFALNALSH